MTDSVTVITNNTEDIPDDNADEMRKTDELNFIRSLTASIPLIFPQLRDSNDTNSDFNSSDAFHFLRTIGGYGLTMLISFDEVENKYSLLHFCGGDNVLNEAFFKIENINTEDQKVTFNGQFAQFMGISRCRLMEAKRVAPTWPLQGSYNEHKFFAAYSYGEIISYKGYPEECIEKYYENIHSSIIDIVVYEHPFTRIGRRDYDSLYLVFVDTTTTNIRQEENERDRHLYGSSLLYRALSEINSNIWMKRRLEETPYPDKVRELEKTGICNSYIRSVKKLAALQRFENFGVMISTLAEIQFFGKTIYKATDIKQDPNKNPYNNNTEWENYTPEKEDPDSKKRRLYP